MFGIHFGKFMNYNTGIRVSCGYPKRMCIETTNYCNLRCVMCNYKEMTRKKQHMESGLFRKIVDELEEASSVECIELQMWGEPLLNPEIFDMLDYAWGKVPHTILSTNAMLLGKRNSEKLLATPFSVLKISIDATTKKTYDKIRVGGDFGKVVRNTKRFLRMKGRNALPITFVQLIEMRENSHEVEDFRNMWRDLADEVSIVRLSSMGRKRTSEMGVRDYMAGWDYPCGSPWNRMYVYADGTVPFCGNDVNGMEILGDLNTQSVREVWNSEEAFFIRDLLRQREGLPLECVACREWDMNGTYDWRQVLGVGLKKLKGGVRE